MLQKIAKSLQEMYFVPDDWLMHKNDMKLWEEALIRSGILGVSDTDLIMHKTTVQWNIIWKWLFLLGNENKLTAIFMCFLS